MNLMAALDERHGLSHRRELLRLGIPAARLDAAKHSGAVLAPRRGWVCLPTAHEGLVRAVTAGARLGCISAAEVHGLWVPDRDPRIHLTVPRNSGRFDPPPDAVVHWTGERWGRFPDAVESVGALLRTAIDCLDAEAFVCVADSALNRRMVNRAQLARGLELPHHARLLAMTDGRADSGLESLVRMRLHAAGITAIPQFPVSGVGRVDLLIGDRLIIECDGYQFHDDPTSRARDRRRDLALLARGYLVVRLDYDQIVSGWLLSEAVICALVERGEHRWRAAHRRDGLGGK
jgi:very-short-patch-repair endonuclease